MLRQSMPDMGFDPDIPSRNREIRMPGRSGSYDMRSERKDSHEPTAAES